MRAMRINEEKVNFGQINEMDRKMCCVFGFNRAIILGVMHCPSDLEIYVI